PMVTNTTTDSELFQILSMMLGTLDDGHVTLTAPGRNIFISNAIRNNLIDDALFNKQVIKDNYLEPGFEAGKEDAYYYGKIKNKNIAYIYFDHVAENFFTLKDFLSKYNEVDGYIIDLRHNQGGDFTYAFSEMGRFTNEKRLIFRSKTKNGKGKNDYTEWHNWYLEPSGNYVDKPIKVLIDRYTISAGERATMALKALPTATLIGDTTNGAHGTMIGRELANGWFYSLVPQKVEMFDGKSYEGIGIAPDIYQKNILSEVLAGQDRVLEKAINEF
ncbi:MAG TPA: S41 family peptidase, partial [Cytophagaceae bacterium]